MLRYRYDGPDQTEDGQEEVLTERQWQQLERTMRFVVEQQAQFDARLEANSARADQRFDQAERRMDRAERRMDRLERFADRAIRAGERRMARGEAEIADLRAALKSFLQAMRRSAGNGKGKP